MPAQLCNRKEKKQPQTLQKKQVWQYSNKTSFTEKRELANQILPISDLDRSFLSRKAKVPGQWK